MTNKLLTLSLLLLIHFHLTHLNCYQKSEPHLEQKAKTPLAIADRDLQEVKSKVDIAKKGLTSPTDWKKGSTSPTDRKKAQHRLQI